ncbi:MAG: hypothetical protein ACLPPF_00795 [Rhodomicrobium sp.]
MSSVKPTRPPFQAIELDSFDARLEAKAAEKGIPTLVTTKPAQSPEPSPPITPPDESRAQRPGRGSLNEPTPRSRMKGLKIELPDYAWIALKKRTAEEMVSLRYFLMEALRAKGIPINEADMVEDGRRFRD